jgi:hypothetical protein
LRTGFFSFVSHPFLFQPAIHFVMPFFKYSESVTSFTSQRCFKASSPLMAAVISMRLLVVCASPPDISFVCAL